MPDGDLDLQIRNCGMDSGFISKLASYGISRSDNAYDRILHSQMILAYSNRGSGDCGIAGNG